jgi:hypothetical protein
MRNNLSVPKKILLTIAGAVAIVICNLLVILLAKSLGA